MEGILVFLGTVAAIGILCYRLGYVRGFAKRQRHKIVPTLTKEIDHG